MAKKKQKKQNCPNFGFVLMRLSEISQECRMHKQFALGYALEAIYEEFQRLRTFCEKKGK